MLEKRGGTGGGKRGRRMDLRPVTYRQAANTVQIVNAMFTT